jgi:hypothetical protein
MLTPLWQDLAAVDGESGESGVLQEAAEVFVTLFEFDEAKATFADHCRAQKLLDNVVRLAESQVVREKASLALQQLQDR